MRRTPTLLLVLFLPLLAGCGEPDAPPAPERHVELEGDPNFRDLGGYETTDGHRVKWGEVFRSGELSHLTPEDVGVLEDLGVRTVVNFLTPEEIEAHGDDLLPPGTRSVKLPIQGDDVGRMSLEAQKAIKTGDFDQLDSTLNPQIHRLLLDDGKAEYAALLRAAIDPASRPLSFHCSHGVHRTGTATALLLSALGVPWETVREDYLLSNTYRGDVNATAMARIRRSVAAQRGVSEDEVDMTNVEAFFVLQPHYIDGTLERAVETHGSIEAYIRDGLGITDDEIAALRRELLEQ